eukprot:gene4741-5191_t
MEGTSDESNHDICDLETIDENSVASLLQRRFDQGKIYSNAGRVLISVNPYISTAGNNERDENCFKVESRMSPHICDISANIYRVLCEVTHSTQQTIIISGESGAGKTESLKMLLKHFVYLAGKGSIVPNQNQAILTNYVLEVFGNAATLRNHNSSRYGKLIRLKFDERGRIRTVTTETYLLEKIRVCGRSNLKERNFHIFYQLLNTKDEALRKKLCLHSSQSEDYNFLASSPSTSLSSLCDQDKTCLFKQSLEDTIHALRTALFMNELEIDHLLSAISGILHLGQVTFTEGNNVDLGGNTLHIACKQLGISMSSLFQHLTSRNISIADTSIVMKLSSEQSVHVCRVFASDLYHRIFRLLVTRANAYGGNLLKDDREEVSRFSRCEHVVNILDFFGFENMQHNGLEQLLINYANEKLHALFVEYNITMLKEEYEQEGLPSFNAVDKYFNSENVLLLLEERTHGLFDILHEKSTVFHHNGMSRKRDGDSSSDGIIQRIKVLSQRHESVVAERFPGLFSVHHFASKVTYNCEGFVERNLDASLSFLGELLETCENDILKEAWLQSIELVSSNRPNSSPDTVCRIFKRNINDLLNKLQNCENGLEESDLCSNLHYVKCLKSNEGQLPMCFDLPVVVNQLRYSGLISVATIHKSCFHYRFPLSTFRARFSILQRWHVLQNTGDILDGVPSGEYAYGKTRVYLTKSGHDQLKSLQDGISSRCATLCQASWRAFLCKRRYRKVKTMLGILRNAILRYLRNRKLHRASLIITRFYRKFLSRKRFENERAASIIVQRWWRVVEARIRNKSKHSCDIPINSIKDCAWSQPSEISYHRSCQEDLHVMIGSRTLFSRMKHCLQACIPMLSLIEIYEMLLKSCLLDDRVVEYLGFMIVLMLFYLMEEWATCFE